MMFRITIAAILVSIMSISPTHAAESDSVALGARELRVAARIDARFLDYVCGVLYQADVPFGIVDSRSEDHDPRYIFPEVEGSLEQILDSAVHIDQRYSWSERDGVIEISRVGLNPPILSCTVQSIEFVDADAPYAIGSVVHSPEVRECALRSGLRLGMDAGTGLSSSRPPRITLRLSGTTVRGALNAIVRAYGCERWIYRELTQKGITSFTIN
jgi:hypothetical protein